MFHGRDKVFLFANEFNEFNELVFSSYTLISFLTKRGYLCLSVCICGLFFVDGEVFYEGVGEPGEGEGGAGVEQAYLEGAGEEEEGAEGGEVE